ncbi:hypothetical protein Tco_1105943 [Tanacetum coccineum]
MIVVTSMIELDSLFGPLLEEYFNRENQVVSKSSAVTTADASDKRQQQPDSTSSTSTLATTNSADGNYDLFRVMLFSFTVLNENLPVSSSNSTVVGFLEKFEEGFEEDIKNKDGLEKRRESDEEWRG